MGRVTETSNAWDVIHATELARLGGTPQLIENHTGFGARWARKVVREHCGHQTSHRRKDDPANWFDKNADRLLHGWLIVKAYTATDREDHRARRLIDTFNTYRDASDAPILDINQASDIIELANSGMAWIRTCTSCRQGHLVVSEHAECPLCRRIMAMLCKGCGDPLPENSSKERRGRPRRYCVECEGSRSRRVLKTDRDRVKNLHSVAVG